MTATASTGEKCRDLNFAFHCITASIAETFHDAKSYGFTLPGAPKFSWQVLKEGRDAYIKRLNGIYESNVQKASVDYIRGTARMMSKTSVEVDGKAIEAKKILIAVGKAISNPEFGNTAL